MKKSTLNVIKPGIVGGNLVAAAGGYFLAAQGNVQWPVFIASMLGLTAVVAGGCAINNGIDRDIDACMQRTKHRATVTGEVSASMAYGSGLLLSALGLVLLHRYANSLSVWLAAFGLLVYVGFYSLWFKRRSVYGTLVGSLSGAVPPVVGYTAAAGQWDAGASILLLMFCLWQMPHSYAIAIYRYQDYAAANIPVLPVAAGIGKAKFHIVAYILVFSLVTMLLSFQGYTGGAFLLVASTTSCWWLLMALRGYRSGVDVRGWARQVFGVSIVTITVLSVTMALDFAV
ncbi:heme o synthase [Halioxenophilus aromaticivorans]|uniref:Protoheme IX farnesyltransferase n=1 Tax=Halioxenophilus aromaticivorans TaxID=1306992 RepID=A0AAV3U4A5_9ALTE